MNARIPASTLLSAAFLLLPLPLAADAGTGGAPPALTTHYELLIGRPEPGPPPLAHVTFSPGTVLVSEPEFTLSGGDLAALEAKLRQTYRLGIVFSAAAATIELTPGRPRAMPVPEGTLGVSLTLLSADATSATYRVRLEQGGSVLAEPAVAVRIGGRAIVATLDGERAPYAFVVLAPRSSADGTAPPPDTPRVIENVAPLYPEDARKARVEGTVVLECTIDEEGRVKGVEVVQAAPEGLTEAAVDAVKRWRYEPSRDASGRPREVRSTVTIKFSLQ